MIRKRTSKTFFLFLLASVANARNAIQIFNIKHYGAVADGKTDNTKAVLSAWNEACAMGGRPRVLIPEGVFLVGAVKLRGPCKGQMVFQVKGVVIAPTDLNKFPSYDWIEFQYIDWLLVSGSGKFDGQGAAAWPHNQCEQGDCKPLPTNLKFSAVTNATIRRITSANSKFFHLSIFNSKNMKLHHLRISAPADSPNTDGIHISQSSNIRISHSSIGTGDDCVSIGPGSHNLSISNVFCGPGHGISVGSLGKAPGEGDVFGLRVKNCTLIGTDNGVRIKTWPKSPVATSASHMTFENIVMKNVDNPIIIDQKYCPHDDCSEKSPSLVKISNIKFHNIRGESKSKVPIKLLCSDAVPCEEVELFNVKLKYNGLDALANALCSNAKVTAIGLNLPSPCL